LRYLIILLCLFLSSCFYVEETDRQPEYNNHSTGYYDYYYEDDTYWCDEHQPFYDYPEVCDSNPAEDYICCTWSVSDYCYQEWCAWDNSCIWEYDGEYCAYY